MNRRKFFSLGGAAVLAGGLKKAPAEKAQDSFTPNTVKRDRPNILLLMADQWRMDCLGAYGNTHIKTPHLDRLTREGYLFKAAYSSTPTCTPARRQNGPCIRRWTGSCATMISWLGTASALA